jgi:hypothetical protein
MNPSRDIDISEITFPIVLLFCGEILRVYGRLLAVTA